MANTDKAFGLKPVRHKSGAPFNGACKLYYVPDTYATALFVGDPVIITSTSNTARVVTSCGEFEAGTLPEINKATAGDGNRVSGVIVGFKPSYGSLERVHKPASTECVVMVADDPDLIFHIQDDGAAALAATSVGLNAVFIYGSGDTVTGLSGVELDTNSDGPAADGSNQMLIRSLAAIPGNEIGIHAIWEVTLNNHTNGSGHATDGV